MESYRKDRNQRDAQGVSAGRHGSKGHRKQVGVTRGKGNEMRHGRIPLAMLFAFAFIAAGMTPVHAHYSCASTDIQGPPVVFHGTVTDPLGPLRGATVWAKYHGELHWTTTGTDGTYEILGRSDCPMTIWAEHSTHTKSAERHFDTPIVEQAVPVDFQLKYLAETWVTPSAFRTSPQTLSYFVKTTAPETGVRVPVVLPSGGTLDLTLDTTAQPPAGWKQWTGTVTVSPTSDERFNYQACVLFQNATGNCNTAGAAALVSQVATSSYAFDTTVPTFLTSTPAPFADVLVVSDIAMTWTEALSGLDETAGHSIKVDGVARASTVSGNLQTASVAGLTPGVHFVEASVRDLAGNAASTQFVFTRVQVTAGPATATLRSVTVPVNSAGTIPPPSTVRFSQPQVDVSAFTETLNASTRVGYGTATRPFSLGLVDVEFRNGPLTQIVQVAVPTTNAAHDVAVLAPSDTTMKAAIPARRISIGDIVVSVPTGFNTSGATASLLGKTVPLGLPTPNLPFPGTPLPSAPIPIVGNAAVCFADTGQSAFADCQIDTSFPHVFVSISGQPLRPVYQPIDIVTDPLSYSTKSPTCVGCESPVAITSGTSTLALRCGTRAFSIPINLCTGTTAPEALLWSGYLNAWTYADFGRYPLWQANHAQSFSDAPCPNGLTGSAATRTFRLSANAIANDGSSEPIFAGTDPAGDDTSEFHVYLGERTGNSRYDLSNGSDLESGPAAFQLTDEGTGLNFHFEGGHYLLPSRATQGAFDWFGNLPVLPNAVGNQWQFDDASPGAPGSMLSDGRGLSNGDVDLLTGVEFRSPTTSGSFDLTAQIVFQFVLDLSECQ